MKKILTILLSFSLASLVLADSYSSGGGSSTWDSESNTTVFVDVQYPNAVLRDGSRTMTAPLDFATYWATGMSRVISTEGTVFLLDNETHPLRLADFDLNLNTKTVTNGSYYGNGAGLTSLNELDPLAVLLDGTRRMTGNLDMNANAITNADTLRANQMVVQGLYDPTADTTLIVDVDLRRLTNIVNIAFAGGAVQEAAGVTFSGSVNGTNTVYWMVGTNEYHVLLSD